MVRDCCGDLVPRVMDMTERGSFLLGSDQRGVGTSGLASLRPQHRLTAVYDGVIPKAPVRSLHFLLCLFPLVTATETP